MENGAAGPARRGNLSRGTESYGHGGVTSTIHLTRWHGAMVGCWTREILGDFMKDSITVEKEEHVSLAYTSSVDLSQQPQASAASGLRYHQEASLPQT